MKKVIGVILTFIIVICGISAKPLTTCAQEWDIHAEYLAKKEAGLEVYEIIGEDGTVWGYYEPYSDSNPRPMQENVIYDIKWNVLPGEIKKSEDVYALAAGTRIYLDISQQPAGGDYLGYVGLVDADEGREQLIESSLSNYGWEGMIVVGYTGNFNFAIENKSSSLITYNGTYSF